jgi:predicted adenine nucleotide alpha hydrolase (AANH) superfamily ATPase
MSRGNSVGCPPVRPAITKPSLLLHVCCAPCATYVIELLQRKHAVTAFFYNPNIYPPREHLRRAEEARDLCRRLGVSFVIDGRGAERWARRMSGRGRDMEGGAHCSVCFWIRLARTAAEARQKGFAYFATTLTISPHKNAAAVNRMGEMAARRMGTGFYSADFKKSDGFKKSCRLSRTYGLYRQDYCGCVYSLRERNVRRAR